MKQAHRNTLLAVAALVGFTPVSRTTPWQMSVGARWLNAALGELRPADRELLRLWAWEQLAPREIAVVLGITPNAASIRLHRATRKLRDRLQERKDGGPDGHLGQRQGTEAPR